MFNLQSSVRRSSSGAFCHRFSPTLVRRELLPPFNGALFTSVLVGTRRIGVMVIRGGLVIFSGYPGCCGVHMEICVIHRYSGVSAFSVVQYFNVIQI